MIKIKNIARVLHYLCYLLSICYLGSFIYSIVCLATGFSTEHFDSNNYINILIPFTRVPFLIVNNEISYMIFSFLIPIFLYGIFFLLSARLFRAFSQTRLFTYENVKEAKRFYLFNILVPIPLTLLASFFVEIEFIIWILIAIHFILGIFSLFFATIFTQGLQLQNEQDLFI